MNGIENYNGNEFHYIASGTAHLYLSNLKPSNEQNKETIAWMQDQFREMNDNPIHKFGLLYNAFTEKNFGPLYQENYGEVLCDIHADSGGLQMVTVNRIADEATKEKIYANQCANCSVAMSFDEIPVERIQGGTAKAGMASDKLFDRSVLVERAIQSGQNLRRQLEYFQEHGDGRARPMMIAQGNDLDTYNIWCENVQAQIPSDLIDNIAGVAIATSTLGGGDLENIEAAWIARQLPLKFKSHQIHYLGIGSFVRLLPSLVFARSGVYKNLVISYDSTSHTGGISRGQLYEKSPRGRWEYTRVPNTHYTPELYIRLMERLKTYNIGFDDPERVYDYFVKSNSFGRLEEQGRTEEAPYINKMRVALFRYSYDNFIRQVDQYMRSRMSLQLVDKDLQIPIKCLQEVRTQEDFDHWYRQIGYRLNSERVRPKTSKQVLFA